MSGNTGWPLDGLRGRPDRRQVLASLGTLVLAGATPPGLRRPALEKEQRFVLVVLGGGVRGSDLLGNEALMPGVRQLAEEGVACSNCRAASTSLVAARRAILTGVDEETPRPAALRGSQPTLFEYLRRDAALPAADTWLVVGGGPHDSLLGASDHAEYGPEQGALVFATDPFLQPELKPILKGLEPFAAEEQRGLAELLDLLDARSARQASIGGRALAALRAFLAAELRGETDDAPGSSDARALRAARALLLGARPRLLVVVLGEAAVAARSFAGYVSVLARIDAGIASLRDAIRTDPVLASSTNLLLLPERARNRLPDAKGTLGCDPNSTQTARVALVMNGPAFARKRAIRSIVHTLDVTPTLCHLLGAKAALARGRVLRRALA